MVLLMCKWFEVSNAAELLTNRRRFGSMLTLCATYFVEHLQFLIDRESLRILLEHTVSFLEDLATVSPTCRQDHLILKSIQRVIFSYQGRGQERCQGVIAGRQKIE